MTLSQEQPLCKHQFLEGISSHASVGVLLGITLGSVEKLGTCVGIFDGSWLGKVLGSLLGIALEGLVGFALGDVEKLGTCVGWSDG